MQAIVKNNCHSVTMLMKLPMAEGETFVLLHLMESKTSLCVTLLNNTHFER